MNFEKIYQSLNNAQQRAVDTIDGPVLVIAGPGTGKTQLLSARVANILKKTDTLPSNILCLTYSEAGARNMQARLASMIGTDAYKVSIQTFHGFCSSVIASQPDYFYNGARLEPAEPLSQHQALQEAFKQLPHTNYFSSRFDNEFTHTKAVRQALGDVKKAALTPSQVRDIAQNNLAFIAEIGDAVHAAFSDKISAASLERCMTLLTSVESIPVSQVFDFMPSLKDVFMTQLSSAVEEATGDKINTKPLTAFKKKWCESKAGKVVLKARAQSLKLVDFADIYEHYETQMTSLKLYDFDDMIVKVVSALEAEEDLRAELQEQYLYVLVDEYQDTNLAQARLLHAWSDNPVNDQRPNLMAVGDDDQAIYSFQGADVSNMLDFMQHYPATTRVVLTDNYRSPASILNLARNVVVQGEDRLEHRYKDLNKQLTAHIPDTDSIMQHTFNSQLEEYAWIAQCTKQLLESGVPAQEIALIARSHETLRAIAAQCSAVEVPVAYEQRDNVLDEPIVLILVQLAAIISLLENGQYAAAEERLPKLFAHPLWHVPMDALWQLSLTAHSKRPSALWLETLRQQSEAPNAQLELIASTDLDAYGIWFIALSQASVYSNLETMLDYLTGAQTLEGYLRSPLYDYFFSAEKLASQPESYIHTLRHLRTIREALQRYQNSDRLRLRDLVQFVSECRQTNTVITSSWQPSEQVIGVQLITAHGAKGREFSHVIILDADHAGWSKARQGGGNMSYPANAQELQQGGNTDDDRLRLFYVALTRAKQQLILSRSRFDAKGNETLPVSWLASEVLSTQEHTEVLSGTQHLVIQQADWQQSMRDTAQSRSAQDLLQPVLEKFKLSASALDTFLDLEHAGPTVFLEQYILRFPRAQNINAVFGTAVHNTLQRAHLDVRAGHTPSIKQLIAHFDEEMTSAALLPDEMHYWQERGHHILENWLAQKLSLFHKAQIAERALGSHILIGDVRVTGKIDVMEPDGLNMIVTDYKTGRPESSWSLEFPKSAKLYTYRRQLTFYKMLVEASLFQNKRYTVEKGIVSFIPPAKDTDELIDLETELRSEDVERLKKLITVVWQHIMTLTMPDVSSYKPTLEGIKQFEEDLLEGKI